MIMRLAMAQGSMSRSLSENLEKSVDDMRMAAKSGADMIIFPELQLSPFFPKYRNGNADEYLLTLQSEEINKLRQACKELRLWASPNVYLSLDSKKYDVSLMINDKGEIVGISKMVHIYQAEHFYEKDYYMPSDDGFKVYDTPFGKIGIVICFDRHIPESVRMCAAQGAQLIIIPTANLTTENQELFEWEVRVQAYQNLVYIAMCNRVGKEDDLIFCGRSILASPDGEKVFMADYKEQLITLDVDLRGVQKVRSARPWIEEFCSTIVTQSKREDDHAEI